MRIVVTGGGTGGHIYPALAVSEVLTKDPGVEALLYIGKRSSLEQEVIPAHGIDFKGIDFFGMPRTFTWRFIPWSFSLFRALQKSLKLLEEFKPDVVYGTGGYVSAPVLLSAKILGIPYVIHEPDAHPGLVNRLTGLWASAATAAFREAQSMIKTRQFYTTGNPLRGSIGNIPKDEALKKLGKDWSPSDTVLVITGGSQGSRTINLAVSGALPRLIDDMGFRVIHQTGPKQYDETLAAVQKSGYENNPSLLLAPYFDDMAPIWGAADLAICRAGSLSLSELYNCGLPSILVPFPYAAADHQRKNAQASEAAGASFMILDKNCTANELVRALNRIFSEPEHLEKMKQASRSLAHPDATQSIVAVIKSCIQP